MVFGFKNEKLYCFLNKKAINNIKNTKFNPALEDVNNKSQPSPVVKKIYHPMTNFNLNNNLIILFRFS